MWAVLLVITVRKCGAKADHFQAACRDARREAVTDESTPTDPAARDPRPDETAALADLVEQMLAGLGEREQEVTRMTLEGYTPGEIRGHLGCSDRPFTRILNRVRDQLRKVYDASAA